MPRANAATVLSFSRDKELLYLRGEVLKSAGFKVVNVLSVEAAIGELADSIDLVLIGHTVSYDEALTVAKSAKEFSNGRIGVIVIRKTLKPIQEEEIDEFIDSMAKPEELVNCVRAVVSRVSKRK